MRLSVRLALIVVPFVVLGLTAVFLLTSLQVIDEFTQIEKAQARAQGKALREAIDQDLDALDTTALDWAHWDDSYRYVRGEFPEYEAIDLTPKSLAAYSLSFMLYLDAAGEVVYATGFDAANATFLPAPPELTTAAGRASLGLLPLATEDGHQRGIVHAGGQQHLVSSWAILRSDESGPVAGTMTWGRAIDPAYVDGLALREGIDLHIAPWRPDHLASLPDEETIAVHARSDRHLRLRDHMVALRSGRKDAPPPAVRGNDEVGEMAREFAALMADLEASQQALLATQRDLERRNSDLKGFSSVVSHDLVSPLSTVTVSVAILRQRAAERGDQAALEALDRIRRTTDRIAGRVQGLLAYARSAQERVAKSPVDLAKAVATVRHDMAADIEAAGATIRHDAMPTVAADPSLLEQVLQNLFSNAIKYARPGVAPEIRLTAEDRGTAWAIHVRDNGRGFTAEESEGLMVPFHRLSNTQGIAGHGIGLASCRAILERHGGHLAAAGEPGVGATFTMVLPKDPDGRPLERR